MKTFKIFSLLTLFTAFATFSFGQKTKTETIPVAGNCGMCKTAIEKAAKQAGASSADWNVDKKTLTVKYNSSTTDLAKIQQGIAAVGYDTRDFKTTDVAYNKLHVCCQYDRETAKTEKTCGDKCEMKDGKCADEAACKGKDCCKDAATGKTKSCCSSETGEKN
jgi:copper chaperone CopZ